MSFPIKDPNDPVLKSLRETILRDRPRPELGETLNYIKIPVLGRLRCVRDKNGFMMFMGIVAYWIYGMWSSYYVVIEPHYKDGHIGAWFLYYHIIVAILCLVALIRSAIQNPGKLPKVNDTFAQNHKWEPCPHCGQWRPPKAHHCRRCQQCVVRMDHHCPWINNCVGEANHHVFSLLLFYAFLFSFNTFIALMLKFWYWPKCVTCDQESFVIKHGVWFQYLSTVMSATMGFFMLMQFMTHHFNLLLSRTTIDNMKMGHIDNLDFTKIKIRSAYNAYRDLCGTWRIYLWPWPCRRRKSTLMTDMVYA